MNKKILILFISFLVLFSITTAQVDSTSLQHSVEQLRTSIGLWDVETEFLNEDGSIANTVKGTYEFDWVIKDRVILGKSTIPKLEQSSGILFYINESKNSIEMVSVGKDGRLWIMTGALGGEERFTQEFDTQDGGKAQLRFTRFNVKENQFESKMDYTEDNGKTWLPGNHQTFRRVIKDKQALTHIVLTWLDDDLSTVEVDEIIEEVKKLESIPGILSLEVGKSIESDREIVDDSFTIAITMKFASKMDMNGYLTNKDHVKFVDEVLKPKLKKIVVYDFEN